MCARRIVIVLLVLFVLISVPIGGFFGTILFIEHLRVQDADPAFKPLVPLGATVLCNPVAFYRHCHYIVIFPDGCGLSDASIDGLASLDKLPHGNYLDLFIQTRQVTDASVPRLKAICRIDGLNVVDTSISDRGIEQLKASLPNANVVQRHAGIQPTGQW